MPLPRGPNFGRADRTTKPQIVADRRRFTAEDVAAIQENYQQELESLLSVDDAVGSLLNTLQDTGELANTLIIYTSDNGFFHGEHGVRSEKVLPYEPGIRTPLIMRGPGVPVAKRQNQLVGNVDLAPTILEAARAATPGRVQDGRSLFGLLRDRTPRARPRARAGERPRREQRSAVPGAAQQPLPLRAPRHHRRVRAVRPAQGPASS